MLNDEFPSNLDAALSNGRYIDSIVFAELIFWIFSLAYPFFLLTFFRWPFLRKIYRWIDRNWHSNRPSALIYERT